ncbi:6142_t:CDS:2 [Funneliformis geosporum]|nr:6142_t:CDS:2 [Funneliformis geosporum]
MDSSLLDRQDARLEALFERMEAARREDLKFILDRLTPVSQVKVSSDDAAGIQSTLHGPKGVELSPDILTLIKAQRADTKALHDILETQGRTLESQGRTLENISNILSSLNDRVTRLEDGQSPKITPRPKDSSGDDDSNGSSGSTPFSAPTDPSFQNTPPILSSPPMGTITLPAVMPAIHARAEPKAGIPLHQIISADLETLQGHGGPQTPFLCAWYGTPHNLGEKYMVFDSFKRTPEAMLQEFWESLLTHCQGCTVYFHNWAGYDCILSLAALLSIKGYKFVPIIRDGKVLSLTVQDEKTKVTCLTIKDSIKLIPGALGKLAKDFGCETQKDHFPHYFNPIDHGGSIYYRGPFPAYKFFEPKRTSLAEWEAMAQASGEQWDFMEQAKKYLRADCEALYQVLVKFFTEISSSFHLNPIQNLSITGVSFRAWKQKMLPKIVEGVRDLSRQVDPFRVAYHGGIVEVYRPHLEGVGYYYDVNSLYPTAMCRPMPTGEPKLIDLTPTGLDSFFGYLWAKVRAPADLYVGLLPIKYKGQLICPGGTFSGFFFSEELKFALANGYQLLEIGQACQFVKGYNTFEDLIKSLNKMKVEAQLAGESVKRSITKLMMNALYGRFGMHPTEGVATFVDQTGLNELVKAYTIMSEVPIGDKYLIEYMPQRPEGPMVSLKEKNTPKPRPMETNVPIAAAVTAYSRMIINQHKLDALSLVKDSCPAARRSMAVLANLRDPVNWVRPGRPYTRAGAGSSWAEEDDEEPVAESITALAPRCPIKRRLSIRDVAFQPYHTPYWPLITGKPEVAPFKSSQLFIFRVKTLIPSEFSYKKDGTTSIAHAIVQTMS